MPTYEYACRSCGEHLEVVQSFSDDPLTDCPSCAGPLRKVFGAVGVVLKGSGFYRTDNRSSASRSAAKSDKGSDSTSSSDSSSSSSSASSSSDSASSSTSKSPSDSAAKTA